MALPEHLRTGARGEQFAARYLREKGYTILASDFATPLGETDIIAELPDGTVCFVEVKTRAPGGLFPPAAAVNSDKKRRLVTNAAAFLKRYKIPYKKIRFDIMEVILHDLHTADINHIIDAFGQDKIY